MRSLVEWETPSYNLIVADIFVCFEGGAVVMRVSVTQTENGPWIMSTSGQWQGCAGECGFVPY